MGRRAAGGQATALAMQRGSQSSAGPSQVGSAANASRFRIDEGGGADGGASLLGSEFAQFIAYKAFMGAEAQQKTGVRKGRNSAAPPSPKKVDAFKPVFFMDSKYNPALQNTHICYEYDAHYKEMDKQWSRAGKKFSDEPRIGKPPASDQGPTKQAEFPQWCEKERVVFGRDRKLKPFARAQQYTRPVDRCTIPYKPTWDDETSHLGPGAYAMPDPWHAKTGHGNIVGTHPIISTSPNVTSTPVDPDDPPLRTSLSNLQLTGSSEARAKSPKAAKRPHLQRAQTPQALLHGGVSSLSESPAPQTGAARRAVTASASASALGSLAGVDPPAEAAAAGTALGSVLLGARIAKPGAQQAQANSSSAAAIPAEFSDSAVWDFYPPGGLQTKSSVVAGQPSFDSAGGGGGGGGGVGGGEVTRGGSQVVPSRKKGFSFGKSTFASSSIDTVTGTTNADLLYRRVRLDDGSPLIYATSKVVRDLPRGASELHAFGADQLRVDETLAVQANIPSPIRPSYTGGFNLDPALGGGGSYAHSKSAESLQTKSAAGEVHSPVTFQRVTETIDARGLHPSTAPGRALPGPISSPLVPLPKNAPFQPPMVLKSRPNNSQNSPPKSAPSHQVRSINTAGLSLRACELLAIADPVGPVGAATEAYRRLMKKHAERNNSRDDALGAQKVRSADGGSATGPGGLAAGVGLDASLVESIGSQFVA